MGLSPGDRADGFRGDWPVSVLPLEEMAMKRTCSRGRDCRASPGGRTRWIGRPLMSASARSLRFAALLAANVQNGPDLGVLQKIWSATVPCLNEFLLDTFPVTLLAGASQLHSGLIHF